MTAEIDRKIEHLRSEFDVGQKMLAELDAKREHLRGTLLRISGAIQALEELKQPGLPETNERSLAPSSRQEAHAAAAA